MAQGERFSPALGILGNFWRRVLFQQFKARQDVAKERKLKLRENDPCVRPISQKFEFTYF